MAEENAILTLDNLGGELAEELVGLEGAGLESKGQEANMAPYLSIVQNMSAVRKSEKAEYDPKAEVGMLYNSLSGKLSASSKVLMVYYAPIWQRWQGQERIVDTYSYDDKIVQETQIKEVQTQNGAQKQRLFPNNDRLVDTRLHFCLDAENNEPVIISMRASQIKKSKKWTRQIEALQVKVGEKVFNPPSFLSLWNLTTVLEKNDNYGWAIKHGGFLSLRESDDKERFDIAKKLQGEIKENLDRHLGIEPPF